MRWILLLASALISVQAYASCPFGQEDILVPSITLAPYTDVIVDQTGEFEVEQAGRELVLRHVGLSQNVRFASLVSIFRTLKVVLQDDVQYCVNSAVALPGRIIFSGGDLTIISRVGNVRQQ
ncbi:hypothetical protein [Pseudobacteriovorax antillogorgiicola]|uniref:Uncharacterized protein n=1 Tax=Pseudobacteriovorax antillogorgiicola TaxID=1513793 RepID=A0A1Y6CRX6_9BACT|nr:hypothetical protein [Pseudobacteriovorax antillogorgiicola]TCS45687.1 hypothetical protein EDD56_12781 [Pseudobacteriovorax antillogorgiicola]SMF73231.1 hypothetical protein SAMN06296036_12780 [Pseudobacteriovorax antillogorgiicola]